jgi:outer membrane protein TolC
MLRIVFVFNALLVAGTACAQAPLTLDEARRLALERQPGLRALELNEQALLSQSGAEGELPDPRLKVGALNWPTRGFPSAREDITQLAITYEQMVPGGDKRRLRAEKSRAEAVQARAERAVLANAIRRDVSVVWLTAWGVARTEGQVRALQNEFRQAIEAATVAVAAGRGSQADVYLARQLLNQSEDRLLELAMQSERARAELGRWIGVESPPPVADTLPHMEAPAPLPELLARLESHPQHAMSRAAENTAQAEVSLAREAARPDRSWEVGYMFREGDRSDMVMLQFAFELPFWKESRQDRVVESKLKLQERAREQSQDHLRALRADLQAWYSEYQRNGERLANFDARVLPDAQARIDALGAAYRAGRAELGAVLEARRALTDNRIQRFGVEVARAKALANIAYFFEHPQ